MTRLPMPWRLTLGEADKQICQRKGAGENSYRSSAVKTLAGLAAYPWALDGTFQGDEDEEVRS